MGDRFLFELMCVCEGDGCFDAGAMHTTMSGVRSKTLPRGELLYRKGENGEVRLDRDTVGLTQPDGRLFDTLPRTC